MIWRGALAVFRFEMRRTLTLGRIAIWLLLVLFPVFIVSVLKHYEQEVMRDAETSETVIIVSDGRRITKRVVVGQRPGPDAAQAPTDLLPGPSAGSRESAADGDASSAGQSSGDLSGPLHYPKYVWGLVMFGLIPEVVTLFSLLLWVTPLLQAELEGKTWIYLAVRPRGRVSVLLGKYLTGVFWTLLAGGLSASICVWISDAQDMPRLWYTMVGLVALAGFTYGALYCVFAALLPRRAMVLAVAYTLIFEFLVSLIPAVINQLTVQYRLRNLMITWMDMRKTLPAEAIELLGKEPAWLNVLILAVVTVALLAIAAQIIQRREYVSADEA